MLAASSGTQPKHRLDALCAKGKGGSTTFAHDMFPVIGDGRVPHAPYLVTARGKSIAFAPALVSHTPPTHLLCPVHCLLACSTCKRLRISAAVCCSKGHHNPGHVDRRPQSKTCALHGLPPEVYATAAGREALLRPLAPQSVHAVTHTH